MALGRTEDSIFDGLNIGNNYGMGKPFLVYVSVEFYKKGDEIWIEGIEEDGFSISNKLWKNFIEIENYPFEQYRQDVASMGTVAYEKKGEGCLFIKPLYHQNDFETEVDFALMKAEPIFIDSVGSKDEDFSSEEMFKEMGNEWVEEYQESILKDVDKHLKPNKRRIRFFTQWAWESSYDAWNGDYDCDLHYLGIFDMSKQELYKDEDNEDS